MYRIPVQIPFVSQGAGHKAHLLRSVIFSIFQNYGNVGQILNIIFIFDMCRHNSAAVVPDKYEFDAREIYFANQKYP